MNNLTREKDVWSTKLQSYLVIEEKRDDQEFFSEENTFSIGRGDGKKQSFVFDSVVEDSLRHCLLQRMKKSIRLIRLGFNASIYINCNSRHCDAEIAVIKDQIYTLFEGFEKDETNVQNGIQSGGEILLFRTVKLSSYELFDNHIIDLSLSQTDDAGKSKVTPTKKSNRYLRLLHGAVTNLVKTACPTKESAMEIVNQAMAMRLFLSVCPIEGPYDPKAVDATRTVRGPPRLLGAIGCVFITVDVEQLVYTIASGVSTTRQSTLAFALFPTADTLVFKPDKAESIHAVRFGDFNPLSLVPSNSDDVKIKNGKLLVSLQSGLQSLSALTRVVKALRGDAYSGDLDTLNGAIPSAAAISTKQHVPYRDSLFTRLLKQSLQGNCSVSMITTVNGGSDNLTKSLRFASEIGCLYNSMWANHSPGQSSSCRVESGKLQSIMRNFVARAEGENRSVSNDSCDKYRTGVSATSHLAAFNDVLSDFQNTEFLLNWKCSNY